MEFSVGDKVMHPQYGPGIVTRMEHRELVRGFEHYFVVKMLMDESTLFIPVRQIEELGVRPVMSQAKLARVLMTLQEVPDRLSKDFKVRQARIREKLASARPTKLAEAVRDLTQRRRRKSLTKVDKRLLTRARELLASEMAAADDVDVLYAHQTIDRALAADQTSGEKPTKREAAVGASPTSERERLVQKLLRQI
jgi:CarD family transcriptional regulator